MEISLLKPFNSSAKKQISTQSNSFEDDLTTTHKKKNPTSQQTGITDSYLLKDINNTKKDIETILLHLNYQTDPDLIDSYSYQLKSAYMRYKFLLRQIQNTTNC